MCEWRRREEPEKHNSRDTALVFRVRWLVGGRTKPVFLLFVAVILRIVLSVYHGRTCQSRRWYLERKKQNKSVVLVV